MLFGGNFYLGLLKIILQNLFFYTKKFCYRSSFWFLFCGKISKQTNSYQSTYTQFYECFIKLHKILLMQPNLLLPIRCWENGWKRNVNAYFSKQMLLFHLFLPFILRYAKKCAKYLECYCYYISYMFSIFIKIIFAWYNLLIDSAP